MPRILAPQRVPWHRRSVSDGARGLVVGIALVLVVAWMLTIGEAARGLRLEMRDLTVRLDRFSARAAAVEAALARLP